MDFGIKENTDVGLHDCRTNRIEYKDQTMSFFFPEGFYFIKDSEAMKNRNAEMCCHLVDKYEGNFSVNNYRKNVFGKIIREDWTDRFVYAVNKGEFEFEFVSTYRAYHSILFQGYVWRKKKPWWMECEIELHVDEITYSWDE